VRSCDPTRRTVIEQTDETCRAVGSGWVGETASRPATSTPQLSPLTFGNGEIYAFPFVTQQLLDDSQVNIEAWLNAEVATEFDRQEAIAFLSGDGANKPRGLLTYVTGAASAAVHPWGDIKTVKSGAAAAMTPDQVIALVYALPTAYQGNAKFFGNLNTHAALRLMKDGQGNYLWQPSYQAGEPATLMGRPLVELPDMADVAASSVSLLYGDMAETYLILDRIGVRVIRDALTNKPFIGFYTTKRVGGGVKNPDAMKALKTGA
jgi:HK97 family phage major capsid protein